MVKSSNRISTDASPSVLSMKRRKVEDDDEGSMSSKKRTRVRSVPSHIRWIHVLCPAASLAENAIVENRRYFLIYDIEFPLKLVSLSATDRHHAPMSVVLSPDAILLL